MPVMARVLSCPNCGARLRWSGEVEVVECRYCQAHVAVATGGRTDRPTQAISIPASRRPVAFAAVGLGLVVLITSLALGGRSRGGRSATASAPAVTSTVADIAATPLAATTEEIASRHRVTAYERLVMVKVAHPEIEQVDLSWDKDHPDHVRGISLRFAESSTAAPAIAERARHVLGRRLRAASTDGHQFSAPGISSSFSSSTLHINATQLDDPRWKQRLHALWTVALHAAFEVPLTGDAARRHELLDLGYPLSTLTRIPFDLDVTKAEAEVHRLAPNAITDGARHRLSIDHPLFENATLSWANQPGGRWTSAVLYFPVELALQATLDRVATCLAPVVGEPKKLVSDHLAGTYRLQYAARGGHPWMDVGSHGVQIYPHYTFGEPGTASGLTAVVTALSACEPDR